VKAVSHTCVQPRWLAFISKVTTPRNFAATIESAAAGKGYWLPEIQERMANLGVRGNDSPLSQLSSREMQVRYMMNSLTNQEIATKMELSLKTIGVTRQSIVQKLGEERPLELMRLARKHRLIDD
jgi:two-component system, NarL family, invasion response regulator UvrY